MAPRGSAWLLLLPVALLLDAATAQGASQFRMSPRELVAQVGTKVTLRCEVLVPNAPAGCSWLFQPRHDAKGPTFLLYHSASGTKLAPGLEQKRFSPSKSSNTYTLTVNSFQKRDEGYYFCSVSGNMMLYFSPFVPVFLPAPRTTTPPPPPTTPTPSVQPTSVRPETCVVSKGAAGARWLDLSCDVYIWAPLASTCAALLLALVITIICHRRNRQRVCKCPRPQARSGGKPSPSGKLV
ncbi:T-cell surface glycoprotein CD8 alpha chain isoform X1 [Cavia porcellus]|uniref:T-cell surface glycoprotein CD8 alpha chain n=1 Tax=Cavia porcellus TaxID=10141 RepID=Q6W8W8_CAVPO|nr:T-cell surface glycoprotein CD8 alpha chain precursor [Cavia porcellus]AAQ73501.1 CD8 alpha [Cavia porcellus]